MYKKINTYLQMTPLSKRDIQDLLVVACIMLLVLLGGGLYQLEGETTEAKVAFTTFEAPAGSLASPERGGAGEVYASKSGTRYYTPGCSGLKRIKPENLISYPNAAAAIAAGLSKAVACK
jgi:hypothetical protein